MRIVAFDELPASLDRERAALQTGAFGSFLDRRSLGVYRRRGFALTEYVAVFAVDRGELVGQTFVFHLPYRTASGVETVAGVASVTTRVDAGHRGIARALLTDVHRREAAAGVRFSLLWTNRGWYAHDLYESLGYRDVYTTSTAVRMVGLRDRSPRSGSLRVAHRGELGRLEELYQRQFGAGYGFGPRPHGFLTVEHEAGGVDLGEIRVFRRRGHPVGYAVASRGAHQLYSGELVASRRDLPALVAALERSAPPGVVLLAYTAADRLGPYLRRRGYLVRHPASWYGLMACSLRAPMGATALRRELAVDRPSFSCMTGDRF